MSIKSTDQESSAEEYGLLSSEERDSFSQIASEEAPYSQRAQALLALSDGATQAEAARLSDLSKGQVRYWLAKFRRDGIEIFPPELLAQADASRERSLAQSQDEEDARPAMRDRRETNGPVEDEAAQAEDKSKSKKKSKKKAKKAKKHKKNAKEKKSSLKAAGQKGKSGKKKKKKKKKNR